MTSAGGSSIPECVACSGDPTHSRGLPRGAGLYPDIFLDLVSQDPAAAAAVLHGVLAGRFAPHPSTREKLDAPALVIGHGRDLLHHFTDAGRSNKS